MTKRELIQAIAAKAGLTNAQAEAALDAFGAVITEALVADKKIQLPGVFTASTAQRAEREGRNPSTGKAMTFPPRGVAILTPACALNNALFFYYTPNTHGPHPQVGHFFFAPHRDNDYLRIQRGLFVALLKCCLTKGFTGRGVACE